MVASDFPRYLMPAPDVIPLPMDGTLPIEVVSKDTPDSSTISCVVWVDIYQVIVWKLHTEGAVEYLTVGPWYIGEARRCVLKSVVSHQVM